MKVLKISLTVFVIAIIGSGVLFWVQKPTVPPKPKAPENQFTRKIKQDIEQLKAKPENNFCKEFYSNVLLDINQFHRQKEFSQNQTENNLWKLNLESNLYSAYANKFIRQAKNVLEGNAWNTEYLQFIQDEMIELKKSNLLFAGSPLDNDFNSIQAALNKYKEIVSLISFCESSGFANSALSSRYPIAEMQSKINRSISLLNNSMENRFVNNCTRLHDKLKGIPAILMKKHVWYLDNKINNWSGFYTSCKSYNDYSNNLYKPIKAEIEEFGNASYTIFNFASEYNRLLKMLNSDNAKAYYFKYPN